MEILKKCTGCGERPRSAFHKNRSRPDGLADECKSCRAITQERYQASDKGRKAAKKAVKRYQATEKGKKAFNQATRRYCASEHGKQKRDEYFKSPKTKEMIRLRSLAYWRDLRENHPEKYHAYVTLHNALRSGKVKKPDKCQRCPSTGRLEAHHEDYSKPLEVEWLCVPCHRGRDGEHRKSKDDSVQASSPGKLPGQETPC